ncbi:2-C-methyl-D-erythritol 4-phosphate cytidylyltransferase [Variovorax sp. YR216]|uniref:2-C-methyl-D-erythritol 4-phosphate cytidylyltransferase n=1 Tax=Variovorax sp. YR216 TaxID=1882828 RepID=UPI000899B1B8|nr:2-C-methyl-D-erythritol 4-phosphate cytidylyltransferase [Variovorax sp. YR216]SEA10091.1 2-C-methyl-D-erythritol 4-phosphate cytidylyltransferase/2-C-methyl-D-erythritol 4-phosphate cytidylyltransferase / 2-C-methyl-D-erythritol 2,4-cyclodiphosphate synthase [Variovorax sp. YR216]
MSASRLYVLIPSAGTGSRAGGHGPKQYQRVAGRPMVEHTLEAFRALKGVFAGVALVVSPEDADVGLVLQRFPADGEYLFRVGGATRAATVRNGLRSLRQAGAGAHDWVLVHDAARCLVTPTQIEALIAACEHDAVGGLLAHRLADTLKVASPDGRVASTATRADKWLAQTPQMFRIGMLLDALERAGDAVTDEASAIEAVGLAPLLVAGSGQNFKLTYPEDFALADAVLRSRKIQP